VFIVSTVRQITQNSIMIKLKYEMQTLVNISKKL